MYVCVMVVDGCVQLYYRWLCTVVLLYTFLCRVSLLIMRDHTG